MSFPRERPLPSLEFVGLGVLLLLIESVQVHEIHRLGP